MGVRLGRVLSENDQGITLDKKSNNDPFIGEEESGVFANVVGEDAVVLTWWSRNDIFGYEQTTAPQPVIGEEINKEPLLKRRLRYFP